MFIMCTFILSLYFYFISFVVHVIATLTVILTICFCSSPLVVVIYSQQTVSLA